MGCCKKLIVVAVGVIAAYLLLNCCNKVSLPEMDPNPWWGPGKPGKEDTSIRKFEIKIPPQDIEDLNKRLSMPLRLTPSMENTNFTYGFDASTLQRIITYWNKEYKWKNREKLLNAFDHFKTQIEGIDIHFLRVKPSKTTTTSKVRPLLLLHGWPGSFIEFIDILPLLTSPQEGSDVVFEVICPSLPGYGFSEAASKPGLEQLETAQIFMKLMKRLGFEKFYIQGGDWGSAVASMMTTLYPDNILGMHLNMVVVMSPKATMKYIIGAYLPSGFVVSKEVEQYIYPARDVLSRLVRESGYMHIQATKPDTIGAVLNNSPVGLAAYILEKFSTWTNKGNPTRPDGGLLSKDFPISLDKLLDNVSLYWFTGTITSSQRYYVGIVNIMKYQMDRIQVHNPVAFSQFTQDLVIEGEEMCKLKYKDIIYFKLHDGGHFAAMEVPKVLAKDIHEFVSLVERRETEKTKSEL